MNISLPAETVLRLFGLPISNAVLAGWIVSLVIVLGALCLRLGISTVPGRFQSLIEMVYLFFYDTAVAVIGREDVVRELFPYTITVFFYILLSNWSGLIPGLSTVGFHGPSGIIPLLRPPTSDLNTTVALAVLSVLLIQYLGIKYAGARAYAGKFFNFRSPLGAFIGLIELISEVFRIVSFSFRLFGNVFGGEVLIGVILYLTYTLVPYLALAPLPFMLLELFIGLVQAYIFGFLIIVFTSLAVASHGDHGSGGEEMKAPKLVAESERSVESDARQHA